MIKSTLNKIFHKIEAGIRKAGSSGKPVLLNWTEAVPSADPVLFYNNSQENFQGRRFYWSSPEGSIMTGAGEALSLQTSGEKRFDQIIQKSEEFFHRFSNEEENTEPVFFSGFSFHPEKSEEDSLWNDFCSAEAIMPEWMLSFLPEEKQWKLTFNYRLSQHDQAENVLNYYEKMKNKLMAYSKLTESPQIPVIKTDEPGLEKWLQGVEEAISMINNDELKKVVLSRTLSAEIDQPFNIPKIIKALQAYKNDSYVFVLERGDSTFAGASPEQLIEKSNHAFNTMCLAGTIARGKDKEEDESLAQSLLKDSKNLSEHQMVVKMITDAMKEICSEVSYPSSPSILKAKSVQHLYTPVEAREMEHHHILELVKRLHPTPAMGGVPLKNALKVIAEKECYERGLYSSPIGWFNRRGDGEFAVGIRSALFNNNRATLFAGCGIVGDSDPISEKEETRMKFRPMIQAMGGK